jgi:hypothetical protein
LNVTSKKAGTIIINCDVRSIDGCHPLECFHLKHGRRNESNIEKLKNEYKAIKANTNEQDNE